MGETITVHGVSLLARGTYFSCLRQRIWRLVSDTEMREFNSLRGRFPVAVVQRKRPRPPKSMMQVQVLPVTPDRVLRYGGLLVRCGLLAGQSSFDLDPSKVRFLPPQRPCSSMERASRFYRAG